MRETWLSENQRLVSQVLLSEIVCVTIMIPMSNYRIQFLQREHFLPCASYFTELCIFIFIVCMCKCIFSVYVLYVLYIPMHLGYYFLESTSLYSGDTDVEISMHSQDFLYLNILVNSVELAQELIGFFNIRDDLKNIQSPSLILMATVILAPKAVNDISALISGSLVIRGISDFIKEDFSEHFEIPDLLASVFCTIRNHVMSSRAFLLSRHG